MMNRLQHPYRFRDLAFVMLRLSVKRLVPPKAMPNLWRWLLTVTAVCSKGREVYCACCENHAGWFLPYGFPLRTGAMCPHCGCLERHRETVLYLKSLPQWPATIRSCLHLAPAPGLKAYLKRRGHCHLVTADLRQPGVQVQCNILHLPFAEGTFDLVLCHQILEHIENDRQALGEIHRVLNPGGLLMLSVAMTAKNDSPGCRTGKRFALKKTFEFGQEDHVRIYNPESVMQLLVDQRFAFYQTRLKEDLTDAEIRLHGLSREEILWIGAKAKTVQAHQPALEKDHPACRGADRSTLYDCPNQ